MKIESQLRSYRGTQRTVTKTDYTQAGKFQQALGALPQEPKDTFTFSGRAPAAEEAPVSTAALGSSAPRPAIQNADNAAQQTAAPASPTEILPGDTTEVKLAKLRQMADEADYTGMSYGEIYTSIWNRYNDAFDGNMPAIAAYFIPSPEWIDISNQFHDEYRHSILYPLQEEFRLNTGISVSTWSKDNYAQHERDMDAFHEYVRSNYEDFSTQALGYGGMTTEEIEQAICQKYAGKDTLRSFLNMQGELYRSGVLTSKLGGEGAWAFMSAMKRQLPLTYFFEDCLKGPTWEISQARWDAVLDGRFDAQAFAADMREYVKTANFSGVNFDIQGAISQGIDYLLEATAKAQQAELDRHAEREKQAEQAELVKQAE